MVSSTCLFSFLFSFFLSKRKCFQQSSVCFDSTSWCLIKNNSIYFALNIPKAPDDSGNSISSEHNLIWIYCTYKVFTLLCFIFFPFSFCCCWCLCCWLLLVSHHLVFMYIYSSSIPIWNDSVHYSVVSTISFPVDSYQLQRLRKAGNKWTGGDGCTTIMLSITSTGRYFFLFQLVSTFVFQEKRKKWIKMRNILGGE